MSMYNYNHLYYFYLTAKCGGVTHASEHLRISQPSVSSQLKVLEETLNVKLFERSGRQLKLTEQGKVVYHYCQHMFALSEQLQEKLSKNCPGNMREINIAVTDGMSSSLLTEVLKVFFKAIAVEERPKILVSSGGHADLLNQLKFKDLNLLISDVAGSENEFDVCLHDQVHIPTVLVTYPDDDIDIQVALFPWDEKTQWVVPRSNKLFYDETLLFMSKQAVSGKIAVETDSLVSAAELVSSSVGRAFLPLTIAEKYIAAGRVKRIGNPAGYWGHTLNLYGGPDCYEDDILSNILEQIKYFSQSIH